MLANPFLILASAALALASPISQNADGRGCPTPQPKPTLPVNGGAVELTAPPSELSLKHIALGFGIQNYSCSAAGASPKATGALAMLYDITNLYPGQQRTSLDQDSWTKLSSKALNTHEVPLNLSPSKDGRIAAAAPGADSKNPFPRDAPLWLQGVQPLPFLGHHFFNSAGVPQFVLDNGKNVFLGKKLEGIDAPASADKGPDGTGAVAWLKLGDNGGSVGISYVYRVLTSGGNFHGCSSAGADSTDYTATYWFYG